MSTSFGASLLFAAALAAAVPLPPDTASGQDRMPRRALIGYWHNWQNAAAPFMPIDQVDPRYTVVNAAFAVPRSGTVSQMDFVPRGDRTAFIDGIRILQARGVKVLISIGGGNSPVRLNSSADRDVFTASMLALLEQFPFDGIDVDLEGNSLWVTGGTIANPADSSAIHLTDAIRTLMRAYHSRTGRRMMLTMAPETAHVQGGMSAYGGAWGAYLPVIDALRDSIAILHVQLYNSGTMYGIDRGIYSQGTADFVVAMTEAVIKGFSTAGGRFNGLPPWKVAVGLPACPGAAGGGYTAPYIVEAAIVYLLGTGPRPGRYFLADPAAYPDLLGMMTWSINWDAGAVCGASYEYAELFERIFGTQSHAHGVAAVRTLSAHPNPAGDYVRISMNTAGVRPRTIRIHNSLGRVVLENLIASDNGLLDISMLPPGVYLLTCEAEKIMLVKLKR